LHCHLNITAVSAADRRNNAQKSDPFGRKENMIKEVFSIRMAARDKLYKTSILAISVFALIMAFTAMTYAEIASPDEMENTCRNWLAYTILQNSEWAGDATPYIIGTEDIIENDTLLARYYAISSGGYVVVPAFRNLYY
jgi:hypothetical protein